MGCKNLIWGHYCKKKQQFCQDAFEDHEELCVNCSDYKDENEVTDLKKIFNKGPATTTNCACGTNNSTAENDYVSMLEMFISTMYANNNFGFFGLNASQAEEHVDKNMRYLGYNADMINNSLSKTIERFDNTRFSNIIKLKTFADNMLKQPHKDYVGYNSNEFKFVLALILGYLNKLNSTYIVKANDPRSYFYDKVKDVLVIDLKEAVNKTRDFIKISNDRNLEVGMNLFNQYISELANNARKEMTIEEIENKLGYKIKIVGEEK